MSGGGSVNVQTVAAQVFPAPSETGESFSVKLRTTAGVTHHHFSSAAEAVAFIMRERRSLGPVLSEGPGTLADMRTYELKGQDWAISFQNDYRVQNCGWHAPLEVHQAEARELRRGTAWRLWSARKAIMRGDLSGRTHWDRTLLGLFKNFPQKRRLMERPNPNRKSSIAAKIEYMQSWPQSAPVLAAKAMLERMHDRAEF